MNETDDFAALAMLRDYEQQDAEERIAWETNARAQLAKDSIAYQAEGARRAIRYHARRAGAETALSIALSQMPDAHTTPDDLVSEPAPQAPVPRYWYRLRWSWRVKYAPRALHRWFWWQIYNLGDRLKRWADERPY